MASEEDGGSWETAGTRKKKGKKKPPAGSSDKAPHVGIVGGRGGGTPPSRPVGEQPRGGKTERGTTNAQTTTKTTPRAPPRRPAGSFFAAAPGGPNNNRSVAPLPPRARERRGTRSTLFEFKDETGVNALEGLRLYAEIVPEEQELELGRWVDAQLARRRELKPGTFLQSTHTEVDARTGRQITRPGRKVLQYGSFYDYQRHVIDLDFEVEPMPFELEAVIDRLVKAQAVPLSRRPDTCIVNVYDRGDTIPPHVDDLAYPRPFCTVSLLSESPIYFGTHIEPLGNSQYKAPVRVDLARRSALVLEGRAGDVTKHCIPPVAERRISLTFRRMPDDARAALARKQRGRADEQASNAALEQQFKPPPKPSADAFFAALQQPHQRR